MGREIDLHTVAQQKEKEGWAALLLQQFTAVPVTVNDKVYSPNNLLLGIFHIIHKWDYPLWNLITADEEAENKNMACTWAMLLRCS